MAKAKAKHDEALAAIPVRKVRRDASKIIDLCDDLTTEWPELRAEIRAIAVRMDARTGRPDPTKRPKPKPKKPVHAAKKKRAT